MPQYLAPFLSKFAVAPEYAAELPALSLDDRGLHCRQGEDAPVIDEIFVQRRKEIKENEPHCIPLAMSTFVTKAYPDQTDPDLVRSSGSRDWVNFSTIVTEIAKETSDPDLFRNVYIFRETFFAI